MNFFKSNLKFLKEKRGLKQREMADLLGVKRSTYNAWENSDSYPPVDKTIHLAKILSISISELLTKDLTKDQSMTTVPAHAGYVTEWVSGDDEAKRIEKIPGISGEVVPFEVRGDSMYPVFIPGDFLLCRRLENREEIKSGSPYVLVTRDGVLLKNVDVLTDDKAFLFSENKIYPRYFIMIDDLDQVWNIIRRVTGSLVHPREVTNYWDDRNRIAKLEELVNKYLKNEK